MSKKIKTEETKATELSPKEKTFTYVAAAVMSVIYVFSAFYAFKEGADWLINIVLFISWLEAVLGILVIMVSVAEPDSIKKTSYRPNWLTHIQFYSSIAVVALLVATGWFVTAAVMFIGAICISSYRTERAKLGETVNK